MITPSVVSMETKVHSAKTKIWASFHIPRDFVIQRQMNKQSGFNAEQIKRINIQRVKPFEEEI
jgi:hypothetical protein